MIKQRIGNPELSELNDYLLPKLRMNSGEIAAKTDSFIALSIMFRNLSLGFLLITSIIVLCAFLEKGISKLEISYSLFSLLLSVITMFRALTCRRWWARETLLTRCAS